MICICFQNSQWNNLSYPSRLCLWTSQNYCGAHTQYMFSTPVQVLHITLGIYNLYHIAAQDLGFHSPPEVEAPPSPVEVEAPGTDSWF